ncbi:hypothetical protein MVEN_00583200 [Mycena venus]|uniref:Uncharacterized protein n=1 Tax=Mycena venus TaxID=2733690 RepID=A0A8H7D5P4_9AGAR|nr:hypothetical protein MVEN_00583200 [Mycena venus]
MTTSELELCASPAPEGGYGFSIGHASNDGAEEYGNGTASTQAANATQSSPRRLRAHAQRPNNGSAPVPQGASSQASTHTQQTPTQQQQQAQGQQNRQQPNRTAPGPNTLPTGPQNNIGRTQGRQRNAPQRIPSDEDSAPTFLNQKREKQQIGNQKIARNTRAQVRVAGLNVNGRGGTVFASTTNRWNEVNRMLFDEKTK